MPQRYKKTPPRTYDIQKRNATGRGIGWEFTFGEWCEWWEDNLGPDWFKKRGHHTGEYVMARHGDKGPYAAWNTRCALVEENHNDYNLTKKSQKGKPHRRHLRPEVVRAIYVSKEPYRDIAQQYDTDVHIVHRVKCRKAYKALTDGLEKGRCRFNHSSALSR